MAFVLVITTVVKLEAIFRKLVRKQWFKLLAKTQVHKQEFKFCVHLRLSQQFKPLFAYQFVENGFKFENEEATQAGHWEAVPWYKKQRFRSREIQRQQTESRPGWQKGFKNWTGNLRKKRRSG